VTAVDAVERAVEAVSSKFGPIDILLNNAGISVGGAAFGTADAAWHDVFATNAEGLWYCNRAVGRRIMERGGGASVNVGSM
jgi:NAD(P)-dependent dehydrogenase (short-subunit alcohol dehydrogenase family)